MGTLVTDDDKDSLDGEVSSMLQSYPTTLTTFQTTVVGPDGTVQTISRRVETRVSLQASEEDSEFASCRSPIL